MSILNQTSTHNDQTSLKRAGLLFRNILNDLKRDLKTASIELDVEMTDLEEIIEGNKEIPYSMIQKAAQIWPVNERDFFLLIDDAPSDVIHCSKDDSYQSRRVLSRGSKPYYEYRDTAMSRTGLFRPEWIEMLECVENNDPLNPKVQWNNGHFLYQFTLFIGDVNYYYESEAKKYCVQMKTGDSVFIQPYYPHTFTKRNSDKQAYILALTFGGRLMGDTQQELFVLGEKKGRKFSLAKAGKAFSYSDLIQLHLANTNMPLDRLSEKSMIPKERIELIMKGEEEPTFEELEAIANLLSATIRDLIPGNRDDKDGMNFVFRQDCEKWFYPDRTTPSYLFHQMAGSQNLSGMHCFRIECLATEEMDASFLECSLHQYGYNAGTTPLKLSWLSNNVLLEKVIEPGDSFYMRPFVPHSLKQMKPRNKNSEEQESFFDQSYISLRIPGRVTSDEIFEASLLGKENIKRLVADTRQWYDPKGKHS